MYDCIIIGTGPAGLSAALNLKTYKKSFVWFGSKSLSDKVRKAEKITNYPGFPELTGQELFAHFEDHIQSAGLEITEKTVTNVMSEGNYYMVLADNEIYEAKTLILAMGVMTAKLLKGEDELLGRGVSYCATCDGMFYKDKEIAVLCNDPKYEHEVEYLADLAAKVTYFPLFSDSQVKKENVTISKDFPVEVNGIDRVTGLTLKSGEILSVDGVFCLRNAIALSKLIPELEIENGHIVVDRAQKTNLPGCFAAGDCTGRPYQYTKAVGEGNVAAHSCISYLAEIAE
ncbi:MAG: FAD-dependent oxidoreductase [Lachnospiraceae bacterium]|jgi:thioredoxin reductase (NADPH)|uniref:NAD(P)/FAD-dependent oxidoreductase n=1 Tax=Eubacterium ramulus TaxID=39490 RepID=UPI001DEC9CF8|nr:FAD-dependent oxidoreductase [Lachnospiraceae bacterium]